MINKNNLTNSLYWDNYWKNIRLPKEIQRSNNRLLQNKILDIFDTFLAKDSNKSVAEIGGAPGQYLAYLAKNFGYKVNCIDSSDVGCRKTKENFKLLKIDGSVFQVDIFKENIDLPQFDIVISLGFIEHFNDINFVISKHLDILKPGGILILGVPNFLGVTKFFLKVLCPNLLSKHNLKIMNIKNWDYIQNEFQLHKIFNNYVGGFEPSIFNRIETKTAKTKLFKLTASFLNILFHKNLKVLRKFNNKFISGYLLGIYFKNK